MIFRPTDEEQATAGPEGAAFQTGGGGGGALQVPSANGPTATVPKPSTSPTTGTTTLSAPQPIIQPPQTGGAAKPTTSETGGGAPASNSTLIAPGTNQGAMPAGATFGGPGQGYVPSGGAPLQVTQPQPVVQPPTSAPVSGAASPAPSPSGAGFSYTDPTTGLTLQPGTGALAGKLTFTDPATGKTYYSLGSDTDGTNWEEVGTNAAYAGAAPKIGATINSKGEITAAPGGAYDQFTQWLNGAGRGNLDTAQQAKIDAMRNAPPSPYAPGDVVTLQDGVFTKNGQPVGVTNEFGNVVDPRTGEMTNAGGIVAAQTGNGIPGLPPTVAGQPVADWLGANGFTPPTSTTTNAPMTTGPTPIITSPGSSTTSMNGTGAPSTTDPTNHDALNAAIRQRTLDQLNNPSPYDDALFQQQEGLAKNALDEQYKGLQDDLEANLASRGLDWSTIAAGRLNDLATEKGRAWQNVMTQMLTDRANGIANARSQAFNQANAERGYYTGLDDTAFQRAVTTLGLQNALQQSADQSNLAWTQLGLNYGQGGPALGTLGNVANTATYNAGLAGQTGAMTSSQLAELAQLAAQFFGQPGTQAPMIRPPTSSLPLTQPPITDPSSYINVAGLTGGR
jgi:hypothetical protein